MPIWTLHGDGRTVAPGAVVAPGERLSWPGTIAIGAQHVVAMFGATFLVPILTGFPVTTTLFFSGVGTILFLLLTRNKLPSYLGSSFAFIAPIQAYNGGKTLETTAQITQAMVSVAVTGVLLALVGLVVQKVGTRWIEKLMPPVVAGAIVALIGLNLAPAAWNNFTLQPVIATVTLAAIILFSVLFRGFLGRISIFLGVIVGYVVAALTGQVDFTAISAAPWIGLPEFHFPAFGDPVSWSLLPIFLPVILVLIAENVGHVRGVATMTGDPTINRHTGRALTADGVASTLAGLFGGSATTTYGENIGVMAATRV
ncbi:MAG: nitrate reductase, partial [Microbacterium sp.]